MDESNKTNGRAILANIQKNRKLFEEEMSQIKNYTDFNAFEKKWFKPTSWAIRPFGEVTAELDATLPIKKGRFIWYPIGRVYSVPLDLEYEYDLFRRLEYPEKRKELEALGGTWEQDDSKVPNLGKECIYCHIYTDSFKPIICPVCGRKLFGIGLTYD
jgi:hypothetical protein